MFPILAAFQLLAAEPLPAQVRPPDVYSGTRGKTVVTVPRIDEHATIDGVLDEPVWQQAAVLTGFSQYDPVDGRPAEDSTEVLVWYAPSALYFAIRAFAPHGTVNATLADRDRIDSDDYVQLLIDTFNDRRQALLFGINPLGVQADGIRSETQVQQSQGPGVASARAPPKFDLTPNFVFDSKGRVTDYGYEVEVRIPFKSIRYQAVDQQTWGFNVVRKVQRSGHEDTWTPARRANASFLAQSGSLADLTEMNRGLVLDLNPETTGKLSGVPAAPAPGWNYGDPKPALGMNVRWGITTNLTLDGTANPDFSQVEADVGQLTSNQRFALSVTERRPFFLEGIERFETPNRLIYTRRIFDPVGGAKLTGKLSGADIAVLSAVDEKAASISGNDYPVFNLLRLRRDLGRSSNVGLAYTDRIEGSNYDRVAAGDARFVFGRMYSLTMQAAADLNRTAGVTRRSPLWDVAFDRAGRQLLLTWRVTGIHPNFVAASGFIPRPNIVNVNFNNKLRFYGKRGALVESWTTGTQFNGYWNYHGIWDGELPVESHVWFNNSFAFKGGWTTTLNFGWESYAWDRARYTTLALEQPGAGGVIDTVPYVPAERIDDVAGIIFRISTPEFSRFQANLGVNRWRDAGFAEAVPVYLLRMAADVFWRPTDRIRVNFTYGRLQLTRRYDGSRLATQDIPRLKIEYQISRPIFVRFVGQYNADRQSALREPGTGQQFLVRSATGVYIPSAPRVANDIRFDWLFSYRPNPGTVIFAGYGSSMTETDPFAFRGLRRTADGFFVKLSYLFRV